ncbi:VWA domain-containing protein [Dactylosporangium sp. NBC_01737]|uniref:vWA domain-containing protein n=1 Tax=Dactylosporangium sp. NBC_01737 TaxID=2975959 RepID=UPI002E0FEAD1|nr:VWA domain-containing protein [Dactylosporangium sp. NBC_01737]
MTRGVSAQVALVALAICAGVFAGAGPAAAEEGEVKPIDLVVAVDESGSLSPDDVAQEKAAAATIALGELSAQSRVIVFGFASKGAKPAVESPPCVLEPGAGAAGREAMSQCIQQNINRRNSGEGDDTDFVSALNQGISDLGTGDRPKVLFLLTDGRLDVRGDTSYGPDENAQQQHAEDLLKRQVLPKAKERGIQVWPLGFGGDIDQGMLEYFAANGGRAQCDGREVTPKATVVRDTGGARLLQSMQEAFASARCGGSSFAPPVSIDGGGEVTLKVAIPAVATDGTITVYKADPNVTVTFTDPDGHKAPSSGEVDGSKFELAGNSGTVEALRIRNPKPGDWTVKVVAPAGLSKQLVTASALWQGVLRSVFFLDPPSPAPGQTFTVVMRPHTRSIEITDPKVLAGLSFSARLTGAGADTSVALLDDGKGPDAKANDALYSASFQLPANASGSYTVRGVATGTGVAADEHSLTFEPGRPQVISAQIEFDRGPVDAGTTRSGVVRVKNDDTAPHEVRLLVKGPSASDSVSVSPATAMAAPGDSTFTFSLAFASDARGPSGGSLQLIDAASGDVVTNTPLGVTIEEPPGFVETYFWWLVVAAVLLAGAVVTGVALLVARVRAQDVRGLQFTLYRNGTAQRPVLAPEAEHRSNRFDFNIPVSLDGRNEATLQAADPGEGRYVARRAGRDGVVLEHPGGGEPLKIVTNGQQVELPHLPDYSIGVQDNGRIPKQRDDDPIDPIPVTARSADLNL